MEASAITPSDCQIQRHAPHITGKRRTAFAIVAALLFGAVLTGCSQQPKQSKTGWHAPLGQGALKAGQFAGRGQFDLPFEGGYYVVLWVQNKPGVSVFRDTPPLKCHIEIKDSQGHSYALPQSTISPMMDVATGRQGVLTHWLHVPADLPVGSGYTAIVRIEAPDPAFTERYDPRLAIELYKTADDPPVRH